MANLADHLRILERRSFPVLSWSLPSTSKDGQIYVETTKWIESHFGRLEHSQGWDPTFLIRAIGLSEKLVISFGFVFSDLGLKSQNLHVNPKKNIWILVKCFIISDLFLEYIQHILQLNEYFFFHMENHIDSVGLVKSEERIKKINQKF